MNLDWEKAGAFVQAVGVPFVILLLFVGPFVLIAYRLISKYGERLADAHLNFLETGAKSQEQNAKSQEKNAETLEKLEQTITAKHIDHTVTHHAIGLVAQAGIAMLDEDHKQARTKLERVEHVLSPTYRKDAQ